MAVGIVATLLAPNEKQKAANVAPKTLREAYGLPLLEFFKRSYAIEILAFILLFKLGDVLTGSMTTTFLLKTGFQKPEIAAVNKGVGLVMTILGGLFGGAVMARIGMMPSLWIFGILQAISNLGFALLAYLGLNHSALIGVIAFENLAGGLGTAAYVAFLMSLCNVRFTAAQYALFTSLMSIPRTVVGSSSGALSENLGWTLYFVFCTLAALPGLMMIIRYPLWKKSLAD
jgi:PAT family beta-lactamase induction signal transducer AmpG